MSELDQLVLENAYKYLSDLQDQGHIVRIRKGSNDIRFSKTDICKQIIMHALGKPWLLREIFVDK